MSTKHRYTASARLVDGSWLVQVEGFPVTFEECSQESVPDAARSYLARQLDVSLDDIVVKVEYFQPRDNDWRDRTAFYPKGEHSVTCRVFQGGDVFEAAAHLATYLHKLRDEIEIVNATFAFDPTQRLGRAPVEISLYCEKAADSARNARALAVKVIEFLTTAAGTPAHLGDGSIPEQAYVIVDTRPDVRFAVTTAHGDRAWATQLPVDVDPDADRVITWEDSSWPARIIESCLDGLGVNTPAAVVAAEIGNYLAQNQNL